MELFKLKKDGKDVMTASESVCLMKLHSIQGQSTAYAFRFGGYTLESIGYYTYNSITGRAVIVRSKP